MKAAFNLSDIILVLPIICLFVFSLLPIGFKIFRKNQQEKVTMALVFGVIAVLSSAGLGAMIWGADRVSFDGALIFDGLSVWTTVVVLFLSFIVLMISSENLATRTNQFSEYVFLVLNSIVGMLIVAWSNDLIVMFIGLELMSLCLYALIALSYEGRYSREAAFKYFVLGSFAAAIFLYGVALVYGTTGNTYLTNIAEVATGLAATNRLFLVGFTLLILGLGFKVALFPFHAWVPDVYQGASTPITAFMATAVKVVCFVGLLRLVSTGVFIGEKSDVLVSALEWMAVLTMFLGNMAALRQENVKRMLAYSGIAHGGYALVGVLATSVGRQSSMGASSVIYYMMAYSIMTLGVFTFICLFEKREDTQLRLEDLKGLAKTNPWLAICFTVFMMSLAGIPPTVGFFGKFFVFSAAIKEGFFWLAIWGVANSVVSAYYYLRPIVYMYMSEEKGLGTIVHRRWTYIGVGFSALLVVVVGVGTNPFYNLVLECLETF